LLARHSFFDPGISSKYVVLLPRAAEVYDLKIAPTMRLARTADNED
jgi:hypothetical protein